MSQIKFYGVRERLKPRRERISELVHQAVVEVLGLPPDKRAHRFFYLDEEDFFMPAGRTADYLIIEIQLMSGRSVPTKKGLVRRLFELLGNELQLALADIEIVLLESPPENWGFRGQHGDEIQLNYRVEV